MATIWGLRACDACRAARRALPEARFIDVRADGVAEADLRRFREAFGEALVNRRSATWRNLSGAERAHDPLALLMGHPTLMKRPVVEDDQGALSLGWNPAG
ncbi:arsenate reductase [Hasllibacter halocynthiae]|uniref:Arsenate reductase n=1 Tax=Hasllibacter halocynthiae TaxID=595589 RepID=A0A2T0X6S0_9RHOB|nr:ArsC/Spx/MgsR family protein [Hasllibacter halocynthiae]PRY94651.1 arsenate reductase [Hasllibacter halocynthiae]